MKKYCEVCGREVDTKIIRQKEEYEVCGEKIEVDAQVLVCAVCGEEFYCEELDGETLLLAYDQYRKRHKLLLPEEIKKIREQYGLSQRSFAKLLNWGDKTVYRYENGSIQDKTHNSLLVFLREPENMRKYLMENETGLDERKEAKLKETLARMEKYAEYQTRYTFFEKQFLSKEPSIENGFKDFDYDKFCAMVQFFVQKNQELLKVKLLKLLNYADMIFYQENGISMSGSCYVHLPYGPVPQNFDFLFGMMEKDQIAHIEITFDKGYEKHQVVVDRALQKGELTEKECEVLGRVSEKFMKFGSAEIAEYSHREKGYQETKQGEIISYAYAKDIQL